MKLGVDIRIVWAHNGIRFGIPLDPNGETKLTTKTQPERTVSQLPQPILDAIVAGHLGHDVEAVTIAAKTSPSQKDEKREFDALYALDADGMSLLCGGKLEPQTSKEDLEKAGIKEGTDEFKAARRNGACDHFNYGRILTVRATVRKALEESLEGFEKSIMKLAKTNLEGGMADTIEEARDAIVARWIKAQKLPADYVFPANYKA